MLPLCPLRLHSVGPWSNKHLSSTHASDPLEPIISIMHDSVPQSMMMHACQTRSAAGREWWVTICTHCFPSTSSTLRGSVLPSPHVTPLNLRETHCVENLVIVRGALGAHLHTVLKLSFNFHTFSCSICDRHITRQIFFECKSCHTLVMRSFRSLSLTLTTTIAIPPPPPVYQSAGVERSRITEL